MLYLPVVLLVKCTRIYLCMTPWPVTLTPDPVLSTCGVCIQSSTYVATLDLSIDWPVYVTWLPTKLHSIDWSVKVTWWTKWGAWHKWTVERNSVESDQQREMTFPLWWPLFATCSSKHTYTYHWIHYHTTWSGVLFTVTSPWQYITITRIHGNCRLGSSHTEIYRQLC